MNAITHTRCWVEKFVIGLNLCPFAHQPFAQDRIRYRLCRVRSPDAIYQALLEEIAEFACLEAQWDTGLFIVPEGLEDFETYLDVLDRAEFALEKSGLLEALQLASFHPHYVFSGTQADDPANYTNRSPYPMFHLIRQDDLARALEHYPNPEHIPWRNEMLLREMGHAEIQRLLHEIEHMAKGA